MRALVQAASISLGDRVSFVFLERGKLLADGYSLVLRQEQRDLVVPVGASCVIALEPGVSLTHEAAVLAAKEGTLLLFVSEQGTRMHAASCGQAAARQSSRIIRQCCPFDDPQARMHVARELHMLMTGNRVAARDIDALRGIEGAWVAGVFRRLRSRPGLSANGRSDLPGRLRELLNHCTACLYCLAEVAILAAGYHPAIGFIHSGDPRSFVFDVG